MQLCIATDVALVDCQLPNDHLLSLGATTLSRNQFLTQLDALLSEGSVDWKNRSDNSLPVAMLDGANAESNPWQL